MQLLKAFGFGIVSVIITWVFCYGISMFYEAPDENLTLFDTFWSSFVEAAVPEEIAKFICLYWCIKKNKYFDEYMDGIVYAACVALGFAAFENVLYLYDNLDDWMTVGLMRGLMAVPGHFLDGVIMGYFVSLWWFKKGAFWKVLFYPILAHGIYDFICFLGNWSEEVSYMLVPALLIFLYIVMKKGKRMIAAHLSEDKASSVIANADVSDRNNLIF